MTDSKALTPEEVIKILREKKIERIANKQFPFHIMLVSLYLEYGRDNIRLGLLTLVEKGKVKMGHTINDIYFDLPITGEYREIEDDFLIKHNYETF